MSTVEMDKVTFKATVLASLISAIFLFILSTLWIHNGDIRTLQTNQAAAMKHIEGYESIPAQLARIEEMLASNARDHADIMKRLEKR